MVYIVRIVKGRYTYIYECRSRRVPEKRSPVSDRIYVGRVDNETRRFIPKRYEVREEAMIEDILDGSFVPKALPRIPACYLPLRRYRTEGRGPLKNQSLFRGSRVMPVWPW